MTNPMGALIGMVPQVQCSVQFYKEAASALPDGAAGFRAVLAADTWEMYAQEFLEDQADLTITFGASLTPCFSPPWETNGLQVTPKSA